MNRKNKTRICTSDSPDRVLIKEKSGISQTPFNSRNKGSTHNLKEEHSPDSKPINISRLLDSSVSKNPKPCRITKKSTDQNTSYSNMNELFKFSSKLAEKNYPVHINNPTQVIKEEIKNISLKNEEKGSKINDFAEETKKTMLKTDKKDPDTKKNYEETSNNEEIKITKKVEIKNSIQDNLQIKFDVFKRTQQKLEQSPKLAEYKSKNSEYSASSKKSTEKTNNTRKITNNRPKLPINHRLNVISPTHSVKKPEVINFARVQNNDTYENLLELDKDLYNRGNGFTTEEISQLEPFIANFKFPLTCHICLNPIETGQSSIALFCLDKFHSDCLFEWLYRKKTCPICRCDVTISLKKNSNPNNK